ncbi:MAG: flagellar motor protein MotB [Alphaproteobacteria bacterium]|nr:flagellar motor protein MotB [Alphaproteobacteria bacterium]
MSLRRKTEAEDDGDSEDWLATYADAITLLMAFFVMLVSFSKVDLPMFEQVQAGIKEYVGGEEDPTKTPIFELQSIISSAVQDADDIPPESIDVGFDDEGVVIDFGSGSFFEKGTATIVEPAKLILKKIRRELQEPPYDLFMVDVEGHTDSDPLPGSSAYPSNWELSAARAAAVVRFLIGDGIDPERMKASGYANTKPKVKEEDVMGNPLPENKAINRRVTIRLFPAFVNNDL